MRVRYVLTALAAVCSVSAAAAAAPVVNVSPAGPHARVGADREDRPVQPRLRGIDADGVLEEIDSRKGDPLKKAGSLLAAASSLRAEGRTDEAIALLNRVVSMELPAGRESDKLVASAYIALGDVYDDPALAAPAKAVTFYTRAIERMDVNEDNLWLVETLGRVRAIRSAVGDPSGVAEMDARMLDAQLGISPVEIGVAAGGAGATPLDLGDDTCSDPVPINIPHDETMSISYPFDQNWRVFSLNDPRILVIETLDADTTKDTRLDLWLACIAGNPSQLIATDDDGGPGLLSRIETICADAGQYYVKVYAFDNRTPQNFEFRITDYPCPIPVVADEYEVDNEPGLANRIGFRNNGNGEGGQNGRDNSQVQRHSIYPRGDLDWMRFRLSRANWVNIETFGTGGLENPDTILGAVNSGGALFAVNDDKGPGQFSSKMEFCLPPGDYYTVVLPFSLQDDFYYDATVDVQGACNFEQEPNGTCAQANQLVPGELWNGMHNSFGFTWEEDWWWFTVAERSLVSIATDGYDDFDVDTYLELYNGCGGNLLAADDDGGPGFLSFIQRILEPGTYYVKVRLSPLGAPGATFPYSIRATVSEPPVFEAEPNNNCGQANGVLLGDTAQAAIGVVGDKDFYRLSVPADTLVDIETRGPSGDTVLDISASGGEPQIGCDDDSGDGTFSRWSCCLPTGTYCVGVKDFGNNNTIPLYNVDFRAVGSCNASEPLVCPIANSAQCPHPF